MLVLQENFCSFICIFGGRRTASLNCGLHSQQHQVKELLASIDFSQTISSANMLEGVG
jgi:hypothetical protein